MLALGSASSVAVCLRPQGQRRFLLAILAVLQCLHRPLGRKLPARRLALRTRQLSLSSRHIRRSILQRSAQAALAGGALPGPRLCPLNPLLLFHARLVLLRRLLHLDLRSGGMGWLGGWVIIDVNSSSEQRQPGKAAT